MRKIHVLCFEDKIVQQLGFDASDAIQALNALNQNLAQTAQAFANFGGAAKAAATPANFTGMAQQLGQVNTQAVRLTTSFALLSRITFTQLAIRGIREIESGLVALAEQAGKTQDVLAHIQIVSPGTPVANGNFLSQAFNTDRIQVYEAKLELVKTGVKDVGDTALTASLALSKLTGLGPSQAADLLATSINAFHLSADDAAASAEVLETALNKMPGDAASNAAALQRVNEVAGTFGFTLQETSSLITVLSEQGAKGRQVVGQLAIEMEKLENPTGELKQKLEELGLDRATIKTQGFLATLGQLAHDPDFASLFGTQGGIGAEALAQNIDKAKERLGEFNSEGLKTQLASKFLTAMSTDAQTIGSQFEDLKNNASDLFGGVLVKGASNFLGAMRGIGDATREVGDAIDRALSPSVAGFDKIINDSNDLDKALKSSQDRMADFTASIKIASDVWGTVFVNAQRDAIKASDAAIREITQARQGTVVAEKKDVTTLASAYEQLQNAGVAAGKAIDAALESNHQHLLKAQDDLRNTRVEKQISDTALPGGGGTAQAEQIQHFQAESLASQAQSKLLAAGLNEEERNRAFTLESQAESYARAEESTAVQAKDVQGQTQAVATLLSLQKNWVSTIEESSSKLKIQRAALDSMALGFSTLGTKGITATTEISKNLDILNKAGASPADQAAAEASIAKTLADLRALGQQVTTEQLIKIGIPRNAANQIQAELANIPATIEPKVKLNAQQLKQEAATGLKAFSDAIATSQGIDLTNPLFRNPKSKDEAIANIDAVRKKELELATTIQQAAGQADVQAKGLKQGQDGSALLKNVNAGSLTDSPLKNFVNESSPAAAALDNFKKALAAVDAQGGPTKSNTDALKTAFEALGVALSKSGAQVQQDFTGVIKLTGAITVGYKQAADASEKLRVANAATGQKANIDQALGFPAILGAVVSSLTSAASQWGPVADTLLRAATALQGIPSISLGGGTPDNGPAKSMGSVGYFAAGATGVARGTDSQPAMISKGESILSASATQKFFSQIQQLGSHSPISNPKSQTVTNNTQTVGDITVVVPKGSTEQQLTALVDGLQRRIRRGSLKW